MDGRKPWSQSHAYKSPTIAAIRTHFNLGKEDWFTIAKGNNLLNVCGKVHILNFKDEEWKLRADLSYESPASTRVLCNNCFDNANKARVAVMGEDGLVYSASIVAQEGEAIEEDEGKVAIKLRGYDPLEIEGNIVGAHLAPFGIAYGFKVSKSGKIIGTPDLKCNGEECLYICGCASPYKRGHALRITENMSEFKGEFKKHCQEDNYIIAPKNAISEEVLKKLDIFKK